MNKEQFVKYLRKQVSVNLEHINVSEDNGDSELVSYYDGKVQAFKLLLFVIEENMFDLKPDESV